MTRQATMQDKGEGRYPTDMAGFLDVMADARASLEQIIAGRSEHALTELRDDAGWAVKDHLIHIALWERGMTFLLQRRPRHEGMGLDAESFRSLDVDAMNALLHSRYRELSLGRVIEEFDAAHQEMLTLLGTLSWDDLQRPYAHFAPDDSEESTDEPVLQWVFGNTAGHFDEHQPWIEAILARGSGARE